MNARRTSRADRRKPRTPGSFRWLRARVRGEPFRRSDDRPAWRELLDAAQVPAAVASVLAALAALAVRALGGLCP